MAFGGQTNFFGIPIPLVGQKLEASEFSKMLNIMENQLIAGNKGILAGVFSEGVFSTTSLGGGNFSLFLNGSGGNPALSGLVGGGFVETSSTITWTPLVTGNFYYIFVDFTNDLFVDPTAFTPTFQTAPPDFTNGNKLYLATVDISSGTPVIDFNPIGKVRISDLTTHINDFANPHQVTPAQVGNTVNQWNANQIQNFAVDAPSGASNGQALVVNTGASTFEYATLTLGDVVGPGSAVDENIAVFNGTTGKIIKDGLITKAQVQANTAKVTNQNHTGDVIGSTALTIQSVAITGKTLETMVGTDSLLFSDADDSGNLKKGLISDILGGAGDVTGPGSAVDENIAVFDSTTGKIIKDGLINKSAITANTAKVTNATHTGEVTGATSLTVQSSSITNKVEVSPVSGDFVLFSDTSDGGNLKKADVANLLTPSSSEITLNFSYLGIIAGETKQFGYQGTGVTGYIAKKAGSITRCVIGSSETITAGSLTGKPTIGGTPVTATGLDAVADNTNQLGENKCVATGVIPFIAGDTIGGRAVATGGMIISPTDSTLTIVIREDL